MRTRVERYEFRKLRTRKSIFGTEQKPRLTVYRSLKYIYAQIIDDLQGKTLVAASSLKKELKGAGGVQAASKVGEQLGKAALGKGIKTVVFDRGGRPYQGQIKALADGARQAGLQF